MDEKAELVAKGRAEGIAEGEASGIAKGRAEGEIESNVKIALKAFRTATSEADKRKVTETLKTFGLPDDIIKSARKRVKAEQEGKA
jgi:ribose 5-phosphate isomerase